MLDKELERLAGSDRYPFHMPGHKRREIPCDNPYHIDITEIPGFDNLHQPQGLILEAMERLQKVYGAQKSYLLVNGTTGGNLAAVFAATDQKGPIIMGRNCHKSIYHAVELRESSVCYTFPETDDAGIVRGTPLAEYERAMRECPKAQAIVVTSPTYEGVIEPLDEIVALAHSRGIPVIVDAAHGAHLGFHPYFPKSPLESGADIVVMSLHKTLPALTQTSVLHINQGSLIAPKKIEKYLGIFQTSSPSYVLMASICQCIRFLEEAPEQFASYASLLQDFYQKSGQLSHLKVSLPQPMQDPSKIVIHGGATGLCGHEIAEILGQEYAIDLEMSSFSYALAMSSVMDTAEGLTRLYQALWEMDHRFGGPEVIDAKQGQIQADGGFAQGGRDLYGGGEKVMELYEAAAKETETVVYAQAVGRIAAEAVAIYPPGVPLLVPGEKIEARQLVWLQQAQQQGLTITGLVKDGEENAPALSVVI